MKDKLLSFILSLINTALLLCILISLDLIFESSLKLSIKLSNLITSLSFKSTKLSSLSLKNLLLSLKALIIFLYSFSFTFSILKENSK